MKEELNKIWETEYFSQGHQCFWLYNYTFFRILDNTEFTAHNSDILHYPERAFAIADLMNGNRECEGVLYFKDSAVYIHTRLNDITPIGLKKIAVSLTELFGTQDFSSVLIKPDDRTFLGWHEFSYHNYGFERAVPKGVLPNIDLRSYFQDDLPGTFVGDIKGVNLDLFIKYFENFGVTGLNYEDATRHTLDIDALSTFIDDVNARLGSKTFFAVWFKPSEFLGVGNFNTLKPEDIQRLHELGILGSNV